MHNAPKIGAVVRVLTIFGQRQNPPVTYQGTVVPNERWEKPDTFCMTGDKHIAVRNIPMRNVLTIEYVKGAPSLETVRAFRVRSTDGKREYTVVVRGSKVQCNCTGFTYHHKCKHADGVKRKIAA